ncbi:hypothetical protein CEY16_07045 [Halalkalibacillus sediminis]|uniref:Uncharacterized protein n=1 Tax=Halalkalibacillus sediminis TaxID=2018042 RepID=A0A2I0QTL2_9BACI|nr:hypothetical protein [Halalkalibacillus sediminis]PKR77682.1 hypothetical protein CEY16_07045 [Halalkalibacillus sediminis]
MLYRVIILLISSVIFALILSGLNYVPQGSRMENVYYFSFFETFTFALVYSAPVYVLFGLPVSILLDRWLDRIKNGSKYFIYSAKMTSYSAAGAVAGFIFYIAVNQGITQSYFNAYIASMVYGILAANIFFHLWYFYQHKKNSSSSI